MKFWCFLIAIGLIQMATFFHEVDAKVKRDFDGDGIPDDGRNCDYLFGQSKTPLPSLANLVTHQASNSFVTLRFWAKFLMLFLFSGSTDTACETNDHLSVGAWWINKICVSSKIHSARPTFLLVAITILIWNLFVLRDFKKCENNYYYTGRDCGPAEWINIKL